MKKSVMCAITSNLLPEFCLFYDSLMRVGVERIDVVLLEDDYREWLSTLPKINLIDLEPAILKSCKSGLGDNWFQYIKPYVILAVFENTGAELGLWLDVDIIVAKPLDEMFELISRQMLVVNDMFAPTGAINDPELYKIVGVNVTDQNRSVNNGVVGLSMPRDQHILLEWISNTRLVMSRPQLKQYIRCYDQGVFLWTLHQLNLTKVISNHNKLNFDPKRNCYEYCTETLPPGLPSSYHISLPNKKLNFGQEYWGGDTIDEVINENIDSGATILHYAGEPKLAHLCQPNHSLSVYYHNTSIDSQSRNSFSPKIRSLCVGPDTWDAHKFSALIRKSSMADSWIRQKVEPNLDKDAFLKYQELSFDTQKLAAKIKLYKRQDTQIIMESDCRMSMFVPEVVKEVPFINIFICLRHPLQMLATRLRHAYAWPGTSEQIPDELIEYKKYYQEVEAQSYNLYRIRPLEHARDITLIQLHAWEIIETLKISLADCFQNCWDSTHVIWMDDDEKLCSTLEPVFDGMLDYNKLIKFNRRYSIQTKEWNQKTEFWFKEQIDQQSRDYTSEFISLLRQYKIQSPSIMQT